MNTVLTHDDITERDYVERYVAKTLSPSDEEAFESHFLTCDRCQSEIRLATGVRSLAGSAGIAQTARPTHGRRVAGWIGGLALAASIVALLLLPRRAPTASLGDVLQPPIYLGVPVRSSLTPPESLFNAGMDAYTQGRYAEAATELARALDRGAAVAPAAFFRAASLLMLGRSREASDAFQRVITLGDTPYLVEARYYRAKALLREGRAREALADLTAAGAADAELAGTARALADSVREILQR